MVGVRPNCFQYVPGKHPALVSQVQVNSEPNLIVVSVVDVQEDREGSTELEEDWVEGQSPSTPCAKG